MATILTGARQLPASPVAPAAILEALAGIVTPHLSDNLARREGISGLRPVSYTHLTLPTKA